MVGFVSIGYTWLRSGAVGSVMEAIGHDSGRVGLGKVRLGLSRWPKANTVGRSSSGESRPALVTLVWSRGPTVHE